MAVSASYQGMMDQDRVDVLVSQRIGAVARAYGIDAAHLSYLTSQDHAFARRFALELCLRIAGVDYEKVAQILGLSPGSFYKLGYMLRDELIQSQDRRSEVAPICAELGLAIPWSVEEAHWYAGIIARVWAELTALAPVPAGSQLTPHMPRSLRLRQWRWLGLDICLRACQTSFIDAQQLLKCSTSYVQRAKADLPRELGWNTALRAADRHVSEAVGVAWRKESSVSE